MSGQKLVKHKPSPHLAGIVETIAVYQEQPEPAAMFEIASLVVPLVIGFSAPFSIGFGRPPQAGEDHVSFVGGLASCQVEILSPGSAHCLQINFTPLGARIFFGLPMDEIANRLVDPEALLGSSFRQLRLQLAEEADWHKKIRIAEDFVTGLLQDARPGNAEAHWAYPERDINCLGTSVFVFRHGSPFPEGLLYVGPIPS